MLKTEWAIKYGTMTHSKCVEILRKLPYGYDLEHIYTENKYKKIDSNDSQRMLVRSEIGDAVVIPYYNLTCDTIKVLEAFENNSQENNPF